MPYPVKHHFEIFLEQNCHPLFTVGRRGLVTASISFLEKWSLKSQSDVCLKMLQILQFVTSNLVSGYSCQIFM